MATNRDTVFRRRLAAAVRRYAHAKVDDSWKGSQDPARHEEISAELKLAKANLTKWISRAAEAQVARAEIERLRAELDVLMTKYNAIVDLVCTAPVSSGVCCCGDSMDNHPNPMNCGHSPLDMWDNAVANLLKEAK